MQQVIMDKQLIKLFPYDAVNYMYISIKMQKYLQEKVQREPVYNYNNSVSELCKADDNTL